MKRHEPGRHRFTLNLFALGERAISTDRSVVLTPHFECPAIASPHFGPGSGRIENVEAPLGVLALPGPKLVRVHFGLLDHFAKSPLRTSDS